MKYRQFEDLPVWKDSADLARRMYEFSSSNQFNRHPGLRDQLERTALSMSNNIAEGFERGSTNELLAFLYIARGSAGEVRPMLKVLDEWSDFNNLKSQISDLISKSENISRQLYGLIETLKNSGILGQRHLNNKERAKYSSKQSREDFLAEIDRTPH
jgi:four helix bundle protein